MTLTTIKKFRMLTTSSKTERPMIEIYTKVGDIRVRDF